MAKFPKSEAPPPGLCATVRCRAGYGLLTKRRAVRPLGPSFSTPFVRGAAPEPRAAAGRLSGGDQQNGTRRCSAGHLLAACPARSKATRSPLLLCTLPGVCPTGLGETLARWPAHCAAGLSRCTPSPPPRAGAVRHAPTPLASGRVAGRDHPSRSATSREVRPGIAVPSLRGTARAEPGRRRLP